MEKKNAENLPSPHLARTIDQQVADQFQSPDIKQSLWQIANSVLPYICVWYLMYLSLEVSYWITLALSVLASGFLIRIFIMCHDCTHGSFFKKKKYNDILGAITGVFLFIPYYYWRKTHIRHHATANDLDRREDGDIWFLTVKEYQESSLLRRFGYRLYRNPLILFVIGPALFFLLRYRIPRFAKRRKERNSVYLTDLALFCIITVMTLTIGWKAYVLIQLPILLMTTMGGVWLFYVQHQYERSHWDRKPDWNFVSAALEGSSFYKLPKVLQWFSGNIGFHHIHHLYPLIPNYKLEQYQNEYAKSWNVPPMTLRASFKALGYRLWDEENGRFVGFGYLKGLSG